jgi:hypothetical protein
MIVSYFFTYGLYHSKPYNYRQCQGECLLEGILRRLATAARAISRCIQGNLEMPNAAKLPSQRTAP